MKNQWLSKVKFSPPIFLLLLCLPFWTNGQDLRDSLFEEIRRTIEPLIAQQKLVSPVTYREAYNLHVVDAVLNLRDQTKETINQDPLFDLQIREQERDWGLELRTQVYHNFDDLILTDEEVDGQVFPTRLRAGLDWEVLKGGYFARRNQVQQLKNEKEIAWLRFDGRRNQERLFYRQNVLVYFFNQQKIKILEERKLVLAQTLDMLYRIYYLRDILFEEVIAVRGKIDQVEVQLKNFKAYNSLLLSTLDLHQFPAEIEVDKLPVVDLDLHRMLQDSAYRKLDGQILALESANDRLEDAAVNELSLRFQLHQNLALSGTGGNSRIFPSVGMAATVPFETIFDQKTNAELLAAGAAQREHFSKYERLNATTEIINHYYEYNYKLKQYVEFLYKYLLYEEKIRIEQVNRARFTDFYQPFQLLRYQENLREINLELLDLKQQMYLLLMKIYAKTQLKSIRPYLFPVAVQQYFSRLPASRTIFINSEDFTRFDRNFIDNYLRFNDFNYVILNGPDLFDLESGTGMAALEANSSIRLIKMVKWNPSLRYPEIAAGRLLEKLDRERFAGFTLHLHAEDLNGRDPASTDSLVQDIQDFFVEVDRQRPGATIFLSLPSNFPLHYLAGVGAWTEKIILRVDEGAGLEFLRQLPDRILPFEKIPVCVSLDVHQFKDRLKMEAFISQMVKIYPIDEIVINDFQAFVEMDTGMFGTGK